MPNACVDVEFTMCQNVEANLGEVVWPRFPRGAKHPTGVQIPPNQLIPSGAYFCDEWPSPDVYVKLWVVRMMYSTHVSLCSAAQLKLTPQGPWP
jgi:hypothetical protein